MNNGLNIPTNITNHLFVGKQRLKFFLTVTLKERLDSIALFLEEVFSEREGPREIMERYTTIVQRLQSVERNTFQDGVYKNAIKQLRLIQVDTSVDMVIRRAAETFLVKASLQKDCFLEVSSDYQLAEKHIALLKSDDPDDLSRQIAFQGIKALLISTTDVGTKTLINGFLESK